MHGYFSSALFALVYLAISSNGLDCKINADDPSKVFDTITVSQSGSGKFKTIQEAVDSVPEKNDQWIKIAVEPGTYSEMVTVPITKECIVVEGTDAAKTTITTKADQKTGSTFAANAANFVARKITFENTVGPGTIGQALTTYGDKSSFYGCRFTGYQDTIFDARGRHYFKDCYIEGAVDYIWGSGQSFYDNCELFSNDAGWITAQGREKADETNGFVFSNCKVKGKAKTFLGRGYREYSTVVYMDSHFDDVVAPEGWEAWHFPGKEETLTYAEVNCDGPGADMSKRVKWLKTLSDDQIEQYKLPKFIDSDGWIANQP